MNSELNNSNGSSNTEEWFILKGQNRYGPFAYADVIKMLQEKSVFEFDFVWRQGLDSWKRIAELADFSPDRVKGLFDEANDTQKNVSEMFFRRKHLRTSFECLIIAHNNNHVWKGQCIEISEGGAGVVFENALIMPGQTVYLHFKPGSNLEPFNVLCEVVSKKFVKEIRDKDAPIEYGIKFINLRKQDKDAIKAVQNKSAA